MRKFFFFLFFVVLQFFAGAQPGSLDATFNPGTGANEAVYSMVQQPDGKIVIGGLFTLYNGTARTRIARLNADGSLDASFNPGSGASDYVLSMARQADGKILIAGFFTTYNGTARNRIARLNSDGSLDASFNPGSGANNVVYTVAVQPDGKILIGGIFTNYNGTARNRIARLNSDGSLDATFNPGSGAEQVVYPIVVQPDGKIIIGGKFTTYNGTARNCVARLNSDGSLDASFNPGSGANDYLYAMDLQPDGKILIGGVFTTFNGTGKNHIARLNADGSLDASFNSGSGTNEGVFYVIRQSDGKILIGGDFSSYNGIGRNLLARLNADGSLDPSFDPGAGPNNLGIYSMIQQPDGKILIGGVFTTYNGTGINRVARINNGTSAMITTSAVSPASLCVGSTVSVPFTVTGSFTAGNIFTAQLSDASGSFAASVAVGTLSSTTSGTITATIPTTTAGGTGYRIRVISSNPAVTGTDNGSNLQIIKITTTSTQTDVSCNGGSNGTATITASGGAAPYTYSWSHSDNITAMATGLAAGTYTVTVTDNTGCQATSDIIITEPAAAVWGSAVVTNVSCNGGNNGAIDLTPSGGTSPYTYNWGGGITTQDRVNLAAGSYSVTITDAKGCTGVVNATVTQPDALTLSSISVPANGTYTGGDDLDFTISFNHAVTVDPAGGTPYINLTLATGTTRAHYVGGSGTNSLLFRYTVGVNDRDPDGIGLGGIFSSGGLIQYASGCAVSDPIGGIPSSTGIIISNPVSQTITFNPLANKTYGDGDFDPGAMASSGLAVSYSSSNTGVATIVAGKIHIVGAGSTIITATQTGNSDYLAATSIQQTLTVNPATLTITANNQSKVYGAANPAFTASYSGFVNGDNASVLTTQPTFATTATTSSSVGNYPITVSGAVSSKYIISYVAGNLAVTPAALTITANNQTKTYGVGVPALTASYSGFVNGDNASSLSTAPTLSTTATAASAVGDYTITPSGAVASNYAISYATGTLSVTPASLTITADDKTKVYGVAVPTLTASYSGFVNGDDASSLTTQPVLSTSATVSSGVGTYAITASGAVASNYTISYVSGTLTVSAAQPVIIFGSLPVKTYGDTDFDAGATSDNASTPVMYSSDNTAVATIVNGKVRVVGAGTANITASQASDANHTAATDVIRQLTVNKAAITIAADAKNKTYGESDPALSYQITSGALVGTDNFTGSLVRDAGEDAGNYVINQGTLDLNSNYTLTYNPADLTINKAAITITAAAKTKTYGQSDPVLTYQVSSGALVGTDTFTGSLTRDAGENAGSYAIKQGTLALNTNYILTYTGASLIVNKASLTITADNKTKAYGQNNPVFTASYSGFVNGDNASGLAVQPTFITTAATTSPVGNYAITASGADDPNYTISYIAGNLSITPAALIITADNKIKVYGEADPVLTYSITGLVDSDDLTGSLVRTPGNNAGVYAIQQGSLSATNNYVLSYQGANFTITPKPVTVAADAQTKIYGQPDPAFTYSVSPVLLNGDVLNGALSRTAGEDAGSYAINQGSLNHPNYTLSFTGNALTINKAAQQITWNQTLVAGCDGSTTIALTAVASSGLPVSYQSGNVGIATITNNQLVITGTGTTSITASQAGNNNYLPAADIQQELLSKLPAHLLVKRWDDVLVFDNSSNQFTAWQWYKNGVAINGATGQYYYESGKLNGDYYAVVKTAAGVTMQTCPVTITAGATFIPISIFPNPVVPGQTITVKTGYSAAQLQGATIVVTNMLGAVVQTVQNVAPQTTITMPFARGLYAIRLKLANGVTASVNALVKP